MRPLLRRLIDLRTFQRLRRLKQLATIHLALPGAMHTRFEHSIGVYHLATHAFNVLREKQKEMAADPPERKRPGGFAPYDLNDDHLLAVQLAALLHDIGHGPYSHVFDLFLAANAPTTPKKHDRVTEKVIRGEIGDGDIHDFLDEVYQAYDKPAILHPENIANIASGKPPNQEAGGANYRFLSQIISSPWGVDRLDYLRRDSLHTGIETGRLDIWELIDAYTFKKGVVQTETSSYEAWSLALEITAANWLEAMLDTRDLCYRLVYFSEANRVAVEMLFRAMQAKYWELLETEGQPGEIWLDFWMKDDFELMMWLCNGEEGTLAQNLAHRVHERTLYEPLPLDIRILKQSDPEACRVLQEMIDLAPESYRRFLQKEQQATQTLTTLPRNETIIFDIHQPPLEGGLAFEDEILYDEITDEYKSLITACPHLSLKAGLTFPGFQFSIDPDDLYKRQIATLRIYVPYELTSTVVADALENIRTGQLSPGEFIGSVQETLQPIADTILKRLLDELSITDESKANLRKQLEGNLKHQVIALSENIPAISS